MQHTSSREKLGLAFFSLAKLLLGSVVMNYSNAIYLQTISLYFFKKNLLKYDVKFMSIKETTLSSLHKTTYHLSIQSSITSLILHILSKNLEHLI